MSFKVGDRVVCINDLFLGRFDIFLGTIKAPVRNKIYTIRSFDVDEEGLIGLRFEEIINPVLQYQDGVGEVSFAQERFRKLADSTDEIIKELLENPDLEHKEMQEFLKHEELQKELIEK